MKNNKDILVVGSVAFDSVKTPVKEKKDVLGGSATYFSFAASYFSKVNLVATVGNDFSDKYINLFKQKPIDLKGLHKENGLTFRWSGVYKDNFNERETLKLELNVFEKFSPNIPDAYKNNKYIFLANIDPTLQINILKQIHKPKLVAFDTIDHWIREKRNEIMELLSLSDVLVINDSEIKLLTGKSNIFEAARRLLKQSNMIAIVVKKGEHGAVSVGKNWAFFVPAYPVEKVYDPTGAGDTFAGGFIGYLSSCKNIDEDSIKKATVYGSVLASFCVEDFSIGKLLNLTRKDISDRYNAFRKFTQLTKF